MSLDAWFHGGPGFLPRPEKVVFPITAKSDVADLKDALVIKVGQRVNLGLFELFLATNDAGRGWTPSGGVLDEMQPLLGLLPASASDVNFFVLSSFARGHPSASAQKQVPLSSFGPLSVRLVIKGHYRCRHLTSPSIAIII